MLRLANFAYTLNNVDGGDFQVYVDRVLRSELGYWEAETVSAERPTKARFLVGFADDEADIGISVVYGDFIVDEVELWFQDRNTLLAFGYIVRGKSAFLAEYRSNYFVKKTAKNKSTILL